jgi:TPR repeat protein
MEHDARKFLREGFALRDASVRRSLARSFAALILVLFVPTAFSSASAAGDPQALAAYNAENYREAMRLYRPLAEQGDAEAQYYVGHMYEKGDGVKKDQSEMVKWYRKSSENGFAPAQYRLAVGYAFGAGGLSKDQDEAVKWLQRSAEGGHKKAQKILGRAYAEGRFGLPVDPKKAEYWTKKAESNS